MPLHRRIDVQLTGIWPKICQWFSEGKGVSARNTYNNNENNDDSHDDTDCDNDNNEDNNGSNYDNNNNNNNKNHNNDDSNSVKNQGNLPRPWPVKIGSIL